MDLRVLFQRPLTSISPYHRTRSHGYNQMVSKCSNPHCSASFLYLRTGKLFRFDTPNGHEAADWGGPKPVKKVEFFWLCEACVTKFTLVTDIGLGARVVSLHAHARAAGAGL
jgi:hypothetical protein